jgi:hypothetical protein
MCVALLEARHRGDEPVETAGRTMAEEHNLAPDDEGMPDPVVLEEDEDKRSYGTLGTVLLVILIVVVILLFWRQCASSGGESGVEGAGGVIESVDDLQVQEGAISIWVKPEGDVEAILTRNGLADAGYIFMGDGTYIVSSSKSDLENIVANLKQDPDLYDAGFVYTDDF